MNYEDAVAWLESTQRFGIKLGLENIIRLTEALGIDLGTRGAPRFLHVAGTNGKGSTCAMLDAVCRAAGRRTGLYTSPHLVTFRERIRIDGELIGEAAVAEGLNRIRQIVADWEHCPTFFEITTALALEHFERESVEVAVLETGMGGRLDATNVVTPAVAVITPIALDHQQWLGTIIEEIAREKAGIIKSGVPVVSALQQPEVENVLRFRAAESGASKFEVVTDPWRDGPLGLVGEHQRWNAALAARALAVSGFQIAREALMTGFRDVEWPGRFQRVAARVVLDGAHNPAAAKVLRQTWREVFGREKATLIVGVLRDKSISAICRELLPIAARIIVVPVQNERTSLAEDLVAAICELAPGTPVETAEGVGEALARAREWNEQVLVTGSLFLVGEALTEMGKTTSPVAQGP